MLISIFIHFSTHANNVCKLRIRYSDTVSLCEGKIASLIRCTYNMTDHLHNLLNQLLISVYNWFNIIPKSACSLCTDYGEVF